MPELSRARRFLVLAICCLSLLIVGMDNTIVNLALPSIAREFHSDVADLQWVIDAYTPRAAEAVVVGCGVAVAVLGLATTTAAARRSAARSAAGLGDASVEDRAAPAQVPA